MPSQWLPRDIAASLDNCSTCGHVAFLACAEVLEVFTRPRMKERGVLTFRCCNSHAPPTPTGARPPAEHLSVQLAAPLRPVVVRERRKELGQYFSELKCRQNLRRSIGLRPSLLAFHTTMSTASASPAARSSFDLGVVGRQGGRGEAGRQGEEDEDDDD